LAAGGRGLDILAQAQAVNTNIEEVIEVPRTQRRHIRGDVGILHQEQDADIG